MNLKVDKLANTFLQGHRTEQDGGLLNKSRHLLAINATLIANGTRIHSEYSGMNIPTEIQNRQ